MRVQPKTESEINALKLLQPGWYPCKVIGAEERISQAGNEMIVLDVQVFKEYGGSVFIKDYLMDTEFGASKIRNCAITFGALASYEAGLLEPNDLEGKEGYARIAIQPAKGTFPEKNHIQTYTDRPPDTFKAEPARPFKAPNPYAAKPLDLTKVDEDEDLIPF